MRAILKDWKWYSTSTKNKDLSCGSYLVWNGWNKVIWKGKIGFQPWKHQSNCINHNGNKLFKNWKKMVGIEQQSSQKCWKLGVWALVQKYTSRFKMIKTDNWHDFQRMNKFHDFFLIIVSNITLLEQMNSTVNYMA